MTGYFRCGMSAGCKEAGGRLRQVSQQKMPVCRDFTGATGLEPATSGVTGRSWRYRAERGSAGIPAVSRTSTPCVAGIRGYRQDLPATSCGICAGCVVAANGNQAGLLEEVRGSTTTSRNGLSHCSRSSIARRRAFEPHEGRRHHRRAREPARARGRARADRDARDGDDLLRRRSRRLRTTPERGLRADRGAGDPDHLRQLRLRDRTRPRRLRLRLPRPARARDRPALGRLDARAGDSREPPRPCLARTRRPRSSVQRRPCTHV
jgi:hypothetical protein